MEGERKDVPVVDSSVPKPVKTTVDAQRFHRTLLVQLSALVKLVALARMLVVTSKEGSTVTASRDDPNLVYHYSTAPSNGIFKMYAQDVRRSLKY